jgi:hypothetical protein
VASLIFVIALLFLAIPAGAAVAYTRPAFRVGKARAQGGLASRLKAAFLRLAGGLDGAALQGMAHDLARKFEVVVSHEKSLELGEEDRNALVEGLDQWVDLCLCAQALERHLKSRPEALVMREIRALEAAAGDPEGEGRLAGLKDELGRRRDIERTLDAAFDRLLGFGARLDSIAVSLAAGSLGELGEPLAGLAASLDDAERLLEASRELGLLSTGEAR